MNVWCRKHWKIRTLRIYTIKPPPEKITLIWNPVDLIPKSHNVFPLPPTKELTLKCKTEAREGLGPFSTLAVPAQVLCTQEALALCGGILGQALCLPLALTEGWGGSNGYLGKIIMGNKM